MKSFKQLCESKKISDLHLKAQMKLLDKDGPTNEFAFIMAGKYFSELKPHRKLIERLASHKSHHIRRLVAFDEDTPIDLLKNLANDEDGDTKMKAETVLRRLGEI